MSYTHHDTSPLLDENVGRRALFQRVAGFLAVAGAAWLTRADAAAIGADEHADRTQAVAVTFDIGTPMGRTMAMSLTSRMAGKIQFPGGTSCAVIGDISASGREVEVSVYNTKTMERISSATLTVAEKRSQMTAKPFKWADSSDVTIGAHSPRSVVLPPDFALKSDCCIECCYGGYYCASAICCDIHDPLCGGCFDPGWSDICE